jgi:acyl dehydratase
MDTTIGTVDRGSPKVGSCIGSWERDTGVANWNRFAAVNNEFMQIHMDDEAACAAGLLGAIGMGNLLVSYLHGLVRSWMGEQGRIERFAVQFRKPNNKGRVTATGTVTAVTAGPGWTKVEIELQVIDAEGENLAPASATVVLSDRPDA